MVATTSKYTGQLLPKPPAPSCQAGFIIRHRRCPEQWSSSLGSPVIIYLSNNWIGRNRTQQTCQRMTSPSPEGCHTQASGQRWQDSWTELPHRLHLPAPPPWAPRNRNSHPFHILAFSWGLERRRVGPIWAPGSTGAFPSGNPLVVDTIHAWGKATLQWHEAHSCLLLHSHTPPEQVSLPQGGARMEHQHAFRGKGFKKAGDVPVMWWMNGLCHHYSLFSNNIGSEIEQPGSHPHASARLWILQGSVAVAGGGSFLPWNVLCILSSLAVVWGQGQWVICVLSQWF